MASISWDNIGYGAIDEADRLEEETYQAEVDYQIEQSYYFADSSKIKRKKCLTIFLPLLIFALLVGVIALFSSRGFDHLYPGHGRNSVTHSEKIVDLPKNTNTGAGHSVGDKNINESLGSDACAQYPKCSGLSGKCCPTDDGEELECCK